MVLSWPVGALCAGQDPISNNKYAFLKSIIIRSQLIIYYYAFIGRPSSLSCNLFDIYVESGNACQLRMEIK